MYLGMGGLVYGVIWNSESYREYFDKYKYMTENGLNEYEGLNLKQVEYAKDYYSRNKNLMMILTAGFYALQIIDANVDAHLMDFDISEDLGLRMDPVIRSTSPALTFRPPLSPDPPVFGLRCCLNF